MNKIVICLLGMLLLSTSVFAAPADLAECPKRASGSPQVFQLNELLAGGIYSSGCYDQDKAYYGFSYTGPTADDVDVRISTLVQGGVDQHTLTFTYEWTTPFTLSYTVEVINAPTRVITRAALDFTTPPIAGGANPTIQEVLDPVTGVNVVLMASAAGGMTANLSAKLVEVTNTVSPSGQSITSFTNTFFETVVPEPATYAFIGSGLLALALFRRRKA